jgi:hypothetical protein
MISGSLADRTTPPPLGVELTGIAPPAHYMCDPRAGIPKAIYSYKGQSLVSTPFYWIKGIIIALMYALSFFAVGFGCWG